MKDGHDYAVSAMCDAFRREAEMENALETFRGANEELAARVRFLEGRAPVVPVQIKREPVV